MTNNVLAGPWLENSDREIRRRFGHSGDDGGDGHMWEQSVENRLGALDQRIEALRSDMNRDFRWTWGGMIAGLILLLGVLAKGFGWLS